MTAARRPQLGSVIWAEIADANGVRKVRPVVIVTATAKIVSDGTVRVVAITTRVANPLPADHVLLPWDAQGKARSGLRRKSAAVSSWQAEIAVSSIKEVVGILPPAVIDELLTKVAGFLSPPAQGDAISDKNSGG